MLDQFLLSPILYDASLIPSPSDVDAWTRIGFVGALLVALVLLGRRFVIFRSEKLDSDAEKDARLAEMRNDRDAWKDRATASIDIQQKLTDVAEAQSRDIATIADAVERIATAVEVRLPPDMPRRRRT